MDATGLPGRSKLMLLTRRTMLGTLAASIAAPTPTAAAGGALEDLRGLQTTLLIGNDIGGANDAFARLGDTNLANGVVEGAPPVVTIEGFTDHTPEENRATARTVTAA